MKNFKNDQIHCSPRHVSGTKPVKPRGSRFMTRHPSTKRTTRSLREHRRRHTLPRQRCFDKYQHNQMIDIEVTVIIWTTIVFVQTIKTVRDASFLQLFWSIAKDLQIGGHYELYDHNMKSLSNYETEFEETPPTLGDIFKTNRSVNLILPTKRIFTDSKTGLPSRTSLDSARDQAPQMLCHGCNDYHSSCDCVSGECMCYGGFGSVCDCFDENRNRRHEGIKWIGGSARPICCHCYCH